MWYPSSAMKTSSAFVTTNDPLHLNTPFLEEMSRYRLAHLPTPIQSAERFSVVLGGPNIFIKRDDLTGLATGGNKTRKLEYLIGAALAEGADTIITAGGPQSNHCRQTAAACAQAGLSCHLVFGGTYDPTLVGNRYLDHLLGVTEHWTPKGTREQKMISVAEYLRAQGKRPYIIPVGGSNGIGAAGYLLAWYELQAQMEANGLSFDRILFATSSGGTQAGLTVGKHHSRSSLELIPISIDQTKEIDASIGMTYQEFVCDIAVDLNDKLSLKLDFEVADFPLDTEFLGGGYGVVGDLEREAIGLLARTEGIFVDPVYSGRALGALITRIRRGEFKRDENILFWHTGGETALHAYVNEMIPR
jgi:D-cysteine desulfhydrase family pyridoxal phosphate-dependent enzyme